MSRQSARTAMISLVFWIVVAGGHLLGLAFLSSDAPAGSGRPGSISPAVAATMMYLLSLGYAVVALLGDEVLSRRRGTTATWFAIPVVLATGTAMIGIPFGAGIVPIELAFLAVNPIFVGIAEAVRGRRRPSSAARP